VAAALIGGPALAQRLRLQLQAAELAGKAREQLADRNYSGAVRTLEQLAREGQGAPEGVRALLLLGKARLAAGDVTVALGTWDELIRRYPESDYASKARFLMAGAYAQAKRTRDAALTVHERARFLTGDAYRATLAALYLEIADEAFEGIPRGKEGDPLDPPRLEKDFGRALTMYTQAESIGVASARAPEVAFRIGASYRQLGNPAAAAQTWRRYLERNPEHERVAAATFALGQTLIDLGQTREGRELLARVIDRFADASEAPLALRALGQSWRPLEVSDKEAVGKSIAHWRRFLELFPQHQQAAPVALDIARALHGVGELEAAIAAYAAAEEAYPDDDVAPEARFALGAALLERGAHDEARAAWAELLSRYPSHPRFVEAQARIQMALFEKGNTHWQAERWREAEAAWRAFIAEYPAGDTAPAASLMIARALLKLEDADAAIAELRVCASKYRQSTQAPQAQWLLAGTLEEQDRLADAIATLEELIRTWPRANEAYLARQRLQELKRTVLAITSERAYASNEAFTMRVETRNVPELSCKAYRLDLLEYFRKKQNVGAVEDLAIEVVAPDKAWTDTVEAYEPYRSYERSVPLPLEEKGAWIVAVEEQTHRAVALALRSDLTIVCKQGPRHLVVFARDERTGAPWPGVTVLVSDGSSIVVEGTTGRDGVFAETFDRRTGPLRVLAHHGDDLAHSDAAPAAATTWGYATKAFLHTDRPIYRPNQQVFFRGVVRKVADGLYRPTDDEPVVVTVRDPRGTVYQRRELRTSRFGSFSGAFTLGEEPPLGTWSVVARYAGADYPGTFEVEEYKKPEVLVDVTASRRDYLTGEEVTVDVQASYYFGGAVKEAPIRYWVWRKGYAFDDTRYRSFAWFFKSREQRAGYRQAQQGVLVARGETVADADGKAEISFPTEGGDDDSTYTVVVEARDPSRRWAGGAANVFVTARAFYAVCKTDKKLYRPAERVRVTAIAVDAGHGGVGAEGELVLYKRRRVRGAMRFDPVDRRPLTTGDDGKAEVEIQAPDPGAYRLVFEANDRRGGRVAGGVELTVAGESEDLAAEAKLVCERAVYRRGETAKVLINSPAAPAWALVTFEGEKVLEHRVIKLERRSTTIEVAMDDAFSPNVFLRVAIPANKQLYEAGDEVAVLKYLEVAIEPEERELAPGGELTVRFRATDHAGVPVEAELGVAIVDEAIFAIRPDRTPAMQPFFYDQRRTLAVNTRSSYAWTYAGVTARRNEALLAELERRKWEQEEAQRKSQEDRRYRDALEGAQNAAREASTEEMARLGAEAEAPAPAGAPAMEPAEDGAFAFDDAEKDEAFGEGRAGGRRQRPDRQLGGLAGQTRGGGAVAAPRIRRLFSDTAHWAPHVVTGRDGRAELTVKLPDNLTTWRITARGATRDTLVGEAEGRVKASQDVMVRLSTPRFAVQGDRFRLGALAHNDTAAGIEATLKLGTGSLSPAGEVETRVRIDRGDIQRFELEAEAGSAGPTVLRAEALSPAGTDALEQALRVHAWGVPERGGQSGALDTGSARYRFTVPDGVVQGTQQVRVRLTPSLSAAVRGWAATRTAASSRLSTASCRRSTAAAPIARWACRTSACASTSRLRWSAASEGCSTCRTPTAAGDGGRGTPRRRQTRRSRWRGWRWRGAPGTS
jgi:TolA-binding protein